jgi:hypothetical protein
MLKIKTSALYKTIRAFKILTEGADVFIKWFEIFEKEIKKRVKQILHSKASNSQLSDFGFLH